MTRRTSENDAGGNSHRFWPWIVAVLVGVPVLYLASLPPLNWCYHRGMMPEGTFRYTMLEGYAVPLRWIYDNGPQPIPDWMRRYARIFVDGSPP